MIQQYYDPYLLDPMRGIWMAVCAIVNAAQKKLRPQDTGKRRAFDKLYQECVRAYEWKKIEKEEYEAKVKKLVKVSSIPNAGKTTRLTRFQC